MSSHTRTKYVLLAGVVFIAACNHGEESSSNETDGPGSIAKSAREFHCDTDTDPLVGCWTSESCLDRYTGYSSDVYVNFSYAFRKTGELVWRYREHETSDCTGTPTKIVDDTKINELSEYYEKQSTAIVLSDGNTANVFKVYFPNNTNEINPVAYISYVMDGNRLCLGTGVITGKFTDSAFQYPVETTTGPSNTVNYENCLVRDQ